MEFTVEFYVSRSGQIPVQEFLEDLKQRDPDDHAGVVRGLAKLRDRRYHREPLSKSIGSGLFELRHVGKLNTRVLWFFVKGRRIVAVHGRPQQRPGDCQARSRNRPNANARLAATI